jgi:Fungal specific transcription factor domain
MDEHQDETLTTSKRRRKASANADKKFECTYDGCPKSYSRAEHLYRHQLNRETKRSLAFVQGTKCRLDKPKAYYYCQYQGCDRRFVRQDLCVRHRERHSSQGSQLQKRDASSQVPASVGGTALSSPTTLQHSVSSDVHTGMVGSCTAKQEDYASMGGEHIMTSSRRGRMSDSVASTSSGTIESRHQPPTPRAVFSGPDLFSKHASSPTSYDPSPQQNQALPSPYRLEQRKSFSDVRDRPLGTASASPTEYRHSSFPGIRGPADEPASVHATPSHFQPPLSNPGPSVHPLNNFGPESNIRLSPPAGYPGAGGVQTSDASIASAVAKSLSALDSMSAAPYAVIGDTSSVDLSAGFTYPIFGGDDEYNRSPVARDAEFAAWLFSENQPTISGFAAAPSIVPGYVDIAATQIQGPYYPDRNFGSYYPVPAQHPMSVMSILDPNTPQQSSISEEKRQVLLDLMRYQFHEHPHDAVRRSKDAVFDGDPDADNHILSLRMLHLYIGSYFYHQHAQLPILHRPTFIPDRTQDLLLLAVIAIGAATLDKHHGSAITDAASEFANFIAWHVRWEIVRDEGYRPPAKLWVFQTLILLEVYEKMYATRALHERAHINHDTTLTLMRRGTSFIGRTPSESPGSLRDGRTARSSGSNSASDAVASEESWSHWIRNEATRRIAFAAFVIDSIHATMFGHSAKMVAYEIRLPLPCDEALWSATSAGEVARVQSSHQTNGIKPTLFLDGLKRTLNGERVRTNSFGRTILMSGLLSVNYLLNQRDLQITALGAQNVQVSGSSSKWRNTLLRAFDNWKKDFDDALAEAYPSDNHTTSMSGSFALRHIDEDNLFESRTVLHHLAHMASCVDVFDCQTFAGARRLLGRPIGVKDFAHVRDKMVNRWAKTAGARDAAYYALKFLIQVLVPPNDAAGGVTILPKAFDEQNRYLARDDFLLNRPWVVYFSALVVWCYGYALEGPITPSPSNELFAMPDEVERDMKAFLERVGGVRSPAELEFTKGRNRCLGLLMVLKESFTATRWELMHEAADRLGNCVSKLLGKK